MGENRVDTIASGALAAGRPVQHTLDDAGNPLVAGKRFDGGDGQAIGGQCVARGPQLMRGYYRNEAATAEAIPDGWLRTGDIARIDQDGFVFIVDRKKEIIVTAGGKNIAPQPLENELKLDKYVSQAFIYGDRKPFLVALLTPNPERLVEFAQQEKLPITEAAQKAGIAMVPVNTAADLPNHEQFIHRGFFQSAEHPVFGTVSYPGVSYRMSATPVRAPRPAPALGANDGEVK